MAKLKDAGLVQSTKRGIWVYYSLARFLAPATRRVLETVVG
jgi:DNA-binding transcriptional ArsR family regulator